ncbi:unnamed protein product [Psylliodes chrysocephalus]|uniref:Uncharacterized protein n=1 Tax=Psylliodes chrysocephalus TaxID=3402493 RepID=A0A9P0DEG0_9CUCU|nr:unnamed protein product [Psylliodes chrysocephala]
MMLVYRETRNIYQTINYYYYQYYGCELDSLLEKYEKAAKNEVHYLLYTQLPQGSCQIGCPARSFTAAVVIQKRQWEKISFSSYEWEQLMTLLQDNNFFYRDCGSS